MLWPSPDVTVSSAPPSPPPKCSLLCTSCSAPALQVHFTIGCILFNLHFPSILHVYTLELFSQKTKKYTLGVCDHIRLCDERAPNSMAFNLDISRIYGMQELAFSLGYSSVSDKDKLQIHYYMRMWVTWVLHEYVNPIRPGDFWYLKDPGGEICPHPIYMGVVGGRFQNWVGTSYLTEIDARQKDLWLSDT